MFSKPDAPPPTPRAPRRADASVTQAGQRELQQSSMIADAQAPKAGGELKRKAKTEKPSLIG